MKKVLIASILALVLCSLVGGGLVLFIISQSSDDPFATRPDAQEDSKSEVVDIAPAPVEDTVPVDDASPLASGVLDVGSGRFSISGTIVDFADQPLADAEVALLPSDEQLEELLNDVDMDGGGFRGDDDLRRTASRVRALWRAAPRLNTDAEGAFRFEGLGPGAYRVVARHDELMPAASDAESLGASRPTASLTLALGMGSVVRGYALTPDFQPIPEARLRVSWDPEFEDSIFYRNAGGAELLALLVASQSGEVASSSDGSFQIGGLLAGRYTLVASATGHATRRLEDVEADGPDLQVILEPELVVRGEVLDESDEPVVGANVALSFISSDTSDIRQLFRVNFGRMRGRDDDDDEDVAAAQTGAGGEFEIRGLAEGTYRADVERDGFQKQTDPFLFLGRDNGEEDQYLSFRLSEGHVIAGRVRGPGGEPVAGADVSVRRVRDLPGPDDEENARSGGDDGDDDGERGRRGRRGRGGDRGRPRFMGEMLERMREFDGELEGRTDAEGRFRFSTLREGIYRLRVRSRRHLAWSRDDIPTDGQPVDVQLAEGARLAGRVLDKDSGDPVSRARIRFYEVTTEEDDGERGRGFGGRGGRGGRDWGDRGRRSNRTATTDLEGRFEVANLGGTEYTLRVEAEGYLRHESDVIDTTEKKEVDIEIEPSGVIAGTVRGNTGENAVGVRVALVRAEEDDESEDEGRRGRGGRRFGGRPDYIGRPVLTDEEGRYEIALDRAASVKVSVRGEPYVPGESQVIPISDPTRDVEGVDIVLERSAEVFGLVLGSGDAPVAGATVEVREVIPEVAPGGDEEAQREARRRFFQRRRSFARTDGAGQFRASDLRDGEYEIFVQAAGYVDYQGDSFRLGLGQTREVTLQLQPELTISGTVFSRDGTPIPSAEVYSVAEDGDGPGGRGGRGGRFGFGRRDNRTLSTVLGTYRLGKLSPGSYDLRVAAQGYASSSLSNISAGSERVDFVLDRLVNLAGQVVGAASGMPVEQFRMMLLPENAESMARRELEYVRRWRSFNGPDGAFAIEGLPPGRYTVQIDAPQYLPVTDFLLLLQPEQDRTDLVIGIPEGGIISGAIVDTSGQPAGGARIVALIQKTLEETGKTVFEPYESELAREGAGGGRQRFRRPDFGGRGGRGPDREAMGAPQGGRLQSGQTRADEAGNFTLRGLPDGVYKLRVTHDAYVGKEIGDYVIDSVAGGGSSLAVDRVVLEDGARVYGRVRGAGGVLAGAMVTLNGGIERKTGYADATGRFELRGLGPGTYTLRARALAPEGEDERRGRRGFGGAPDRRPDFGGRRGDVNQGGTAKIEVGEDQEEVEVDLVIE